MSTIIVAAIIVGTIAGFSFLLSFLNHRKTRKETESLVRRFRETGTENNLSFSGEERLKHSMIGLDGQRRKFLF